MVLYALDDLAMSGNLTDSVVIQGASIDPLGDVHKVLNFEVHKGYLDRLFWVIDTNETIGATNYANTLPDFAVYNQTGLRPRFINTVANGAASELDHTAAVLNDVNVNNGSRPSFGAFRTVLSRDSVFLSSNSNVNVSAGDYATAVTAGQQPIGKIFFERPNVGMANDMFTAASLAALTTSFKAITNVNALTNSMQTTITTSGNGGNAGASPIQSSLATNAGADANLSALPATDGGGGVTAHNANAMHARVRELIEDTTAGGQATLQGLASFQGSLVEKLIQQSRQLQTNVDNHLDVLKSSIGSSADGNGNGSGNVLYRTSSVDVTVGGSTETRQAYALSFGLGDIIQFILTINHKAPGPSASVFKISITVIDDNIEISGDKLFFENDNSFYAQA